MSIRFSLTPEEQRARLSPWKRKRPEEWNMAFMRRHQHTFKERFDTCIDANIDLDIDTKTVALQAAAFVVSLVSHTGGATFFMGSGTIIECEDVNGAYIITILTSASVLKSSPNLDVLPVDIKVDVYLPDGKLFEGQVFAYDFHFNITTIKIKSDAAMPTATLRRLDDSLSINPHTESNQLCPSSNLFKLCPGDMVVAVGRYFKKPYYLMAAPGKLSADCCNFDCKELFMANCKITKCGIGGPLINLNGEVIGVNFYDELCTPFLPINIVSKCLEHFKKCGRFIRPWLGMEMTNLYMARVDQLERIIRKFPNVFKGVLVEEVTPGSPANYAGILPGDVIVKCGKKVVCSFLEFLDIILDKVGKSVNVDVVRESTGVRLKLVMLVDAYSPDKFNSWPLPEKKFQVVASCRPRSS